MVIATLAHFSGIDPLMMILEAVAGAEPHNLTSIKARLDYNEAHSIPLLPHAH